MDLNHLFKSLDEKNRLTAIFLFLFRSEVPLKAEILAQELDVSVRTIKNDIKDLKEILAGSSISIQSKPYYGYSLLVSDPLVTAMIKDRYQIYLPKTVEDDFGQRVNDILRYFCAYNDYIKTFDLQEWMYLNQSNLLTKELNVVRELALDYGLKLEYRPHYGMRISGDPFRKILLIVRLYRNFNIQERRRFQVAIYDKLFSSFDLYFDEIKETILSVIEKTRFDFTDIYLQRFVIMILLIRNIKETRLFVSLDLPRGIFEHEMTLEYQLIQKISAKLKEKDRFFDFNQEEKIFLTYYAIMSIDLYRFIDCTYENYRSLFVLTSKISLAIMDLGTKLFQIPMDKDNTTYKDLFKIVLPISMKIQLAISDDVDFGYEALFNQSILTRFVDRIACFFKQEYSYILSDREEFKFLKIFEGHFNRIELKARRLNLAIIALDSRIDTQQIKFNIQNNYHHLVKRIYTRSLYEFDHAETNFDYYLCASYGKYMNIDYRPIYYYSDNMNEKEYVESLNQVFIKAYGYNEVLPTIKVITIDKKYRYEAFKAAEMMDPELEYLDAMISYDFNISCFITFNASADSFLIYTTQSNSNVENVNDYYFLVMALNINQNLEKLKMILNVLQRIASQPSKIKTIYQADFTYEKLF